MFLFSWHTHFAYLIPILFLFLFCFVFSQYEFQFFFTLILASFVLSIIMIDAVATVFFPSFCSKLKNVAHISQCFFFVSSNHFLNVSQYWTMIYHIQVSFFKRLTLKFKLKRKNKFSETHCNGEKIRLKFIHKVTQEINW